MTGRILPVRKFFDILDGKNETEAPENPVKLREPAIRRMHEIVAGAFPWVNQEHEWKGWIEEFWRIPDEQPRHGQKILEPAMKIQLDTSRMLTIRFGSRNIWLLLGRVGVPEDRPIVDARVDFTDDIGMMASVGFIRKHWLSQFRDGTCKFSRERMETPLLFMSDQGQIEIPARAHVVLSPTRMSVLVTDKKRLPQKRTATGHTLEIAPAGWLRFQRPADIEWRTSRLGTLDGPPEV